MWYQYVQMARISFAVIERTLYQITAYGAEIK